MTDKKEVKPKSISDDVQVPVDALTGKVCAVTGGCGFLGLFVVQELLKHDVRIIRALDIRRNDHLGIMNNDRIEFIECNITDKEAVKDALKDADVVFHTASYFGYPSFSRDGMGAPGSEQRMQDINVGGTKNIIEACIQNGIKRLVYTSSVNAVFNGSDEVINGDESMPYPETFIDPYGRTKSQAEKLVLEANGNQGLLTCALRPNGIWGPSKACMTIIKVITNVEPYGGLYFTPGTLAEGRKKLSDWTNVENLSNAHVLAAERLIEGSPVCGEAFNITDGVAINNIEFTAPIIRAMGYVYNPVLVIPAAFMLQLGWYLESGSKLLRRCIGNRAPPPMLTYLETLKTSVTHYFSIEKAKRLLNYEPYPYEELVDKTASFFAKEMPRAPPVPPVPFYQSFLIIVGMVLVLLLGLLNVNTFEGKPWEIVRILFDWIPGTKDLSLAEFQARVIRQCIMAPMLLIHGVDAIIALAISSDRNGRTLPWFIRTLLFGFFQLRLMPNLSGKIAAFIVVFSITCFLVPPLI